jgi:hypothetical protein
VQPENADCSPHRDACSTKRERVFVSSSKQTLPLEEERRVKILNGLLKALDSGKLRK